MSKDLYLYDNEFKKAQKEARNYGKLLSNFITEYQSIIANIINMHIIKDKLITDELEALLNKAGSLGPMITDATNEISETSSKYIDKIDEADDFLY